mmetsp:Transcript_11896/g.21888  ORF Transcript_11896/g.21888 Transcript_11896/m.21888 type:complete len:235 (-) Transcript_11896:116-820(-)
MYMSEDEPRSPGAIPFACRIRTGKICAHWSASIWIKTLQDSWRAEFTIGTHMASPFRFKISMPKTSAEPYLSSYETTSESYTLICNLSLEPIKNLKFSSQTGFLASFLASVFCFSSRTFNCTYGSPLPSASASTPTVPRITPIMIRSVQSPNIWTATLPTSSPCMVSSGSQPSYGRCCKSNIVMRSIQLPRIESKVTPLSYKFIQMASADSTPTREPPDSVVTRPCLSVASFAF